MHCNITIGNSDSIYFQHHHLYAIHLDFCGSDVIIKSIYFYIARSPVFNAMFDHDMEEKKNVSILYFTREK